MESDPIIEINSQFSISDLPSLNDTDTLPPPKCCLCLSSAPSVLSCPRCQVSFHHSCYPSPSLLCRLCLLRTVIPLICRLCLRPGGQLVEKHGIVHPECFRHLISEDPAGFSPSQLSSWKRDESGRCEKCGECKGCKRQCDFFLRGEECWRFVHPSCADESQFA